MGRAVRPNHQKNTQKKEEIGEQGLEMGRAVIYFSSIRTNLVLFDQKIYQSP